MPAPGKPQSQFKLYAAIFLIFGGLGLLGAMLQANTAGWAVGLVFATISGSIACGWAYAFSRRRWWLLIPLNILPFFGPRYVFQALAAVGLLRFGYEYAPGTRLLVLAALMVVLVSVGFTLLIVYLRGYERSAAQARAELDIAARVHAALVPDLTLETPVARVYGKSVASSTMGGDLIDARTRNGPAGFEHLDVVLADVSGHGVGAGLVMGMVKSSLRTLELSPRSLAETLTTLNGVLEELTRPEMFATAALVRLYEGGRLEYALAGHLPIWLHRTATGAVEELPNEHLPLGIEVDERFSAGATMVAPGDTLALYTDGLIEVQNAEGRELGLDALRTVFARHAHAELPTLYGALMGAAAAHGTPHDDQSVVLVRVR